MENKSLKEALAELKKEKKRKFDQSVDLVINLKGIDLKRDQLNIVATMPHKVKEKKVCGFLTEKSKLVKTITEPEFKKYSDPKELRKLIKDYDFFIAVGSLMPKVATAFGKALGPSGKMPSPQLGIIMQENDREIKSVLEKISTSIKLRAKEPSIKLTVGKENMDEEKIIENISSIYSTIENALPKKKDNVKNVMLKLTMTKPIRVEVK